jgi:hypothetical protein
MNKKAQQYYQPPPEYAHLSPVLVIGLAITVLHFLLPVMKIHSPGWVFAIGLVITLIGGFMSIT